MENQELIKNAGRAELESKQRVMRAAGIILFIGALTLNLARIIVYFVGKATAGLEASTAEIISEVVFDVLDQVVFLFLPCLLVSRLYLKKDFKGFLEISNVRKVDWKVCLIAVGIGITAPVMSIVVNAVVIFVSTLIGATPPASSTVLPENFSVGVLLLHIFLIAVLPGVCEEFFNRGIVLTAMRSTFKDWQTVLLGGLVFGLFHQYIFQTFYTGVFGMVLVYIALKTKSIVPTIIAHFTNNFIAVLTDFATFYGWNFLSLSTLIGKLTSNIGLLLVAIMLGLCAFFGLVYLLVIVDKYSKEKQILKKLNLDGKININHVSVDVIGGPLGDTVYYKPTIKDTYLWWGAFAASLACTVCTLLWYML